MEMAKKIWKKLLFVSVMLVIINLVHPSIAKYQSSRTLKEIKFYDDVRGINLSNIENKITSDILKTLTFDARTIWPSKEKMPNDITPEDLIEYGKDPGLGIRELHRLGYTGKGISVALFDQPLMLNHESYNNVNYSYTVLNPRAKNLSSMHGPAVMSLLAGKEIGIAPEANVYYYAYPSWDADQKNEADLFYHVIEKNKTLPDDQKIRIISMSHGVDRSMKNSELLAQAEMKARDAGIIVVDVGSINISAVKAEPFKDKNNPENYTKVNWGLYKNNALYVPTGRTTADGYTNPNKRNRYVFWEGGGLSWAVPYIAGVIALGVQVDSDLTEEKAFEYLYKSGYDFHGGKLINPEGFLEMIAINSNQSINYYLNMLNNPMKGILIEIR